MRHTRPPNEDVTNYHWFVVRCYSGKEARVAEALRDVGCWPFYPYGRSWRWRNLFDRVRRKKYERQQPEMPGYVLIGWPTDFVPWHAILSVRHVIAVVGRDGVPDMLRDDQVRNRLVPLMVSQARGRFDAPDFHKFMDTHAEFGPGDHVTVVHGSLQGKRFRVEALRGHDALVFQQLFGRNTTIRIPVADLAPAG